MIKASQFSLNCGCPQTDSIGNFKPPSNHAKSLISYLKGDPTVQDNKKVQIHEKAYAIMKESMNDPKNHSYGNSAGHPDCREAVAKTFGKLNETTVNDVIMTHGFNMALYTTIISTTNSGDNILVPETSFPLFQKSAPALGVEARKYKLLADKNYEIDLDHLETLIDEKTKFIWICNPSDSVGSVYSVQHIKKIFAVATKHKKLLISNELYWDQGFSKTDHRSLGHLAGDVPVIVISGLDKSFLTPGWSLSWIIFFDRHGALKEVKNAVGTTCTIFLHPNSFIQKALPPILNELGGDFIKPFVKEFEENHNFLFEKLSKIKGLKPVEAQGTFYQSCLVEVEKFGFKTDFDFLQKLLEEQNLWIINLSSFGGNYQGFKLQTCASKDNYADLVKRLEEFCNKHYKG